MNEVSDRPLWKRVQDECNLKLQGIRWKLIGNIVVKSAGKIMYETDDNGTLRRTTPRNGRKTKRRCIVPHRHLADL